MSRSLPELNDAIGEMLVQSQVAAEQLAVAARRYRRTQAQLVALREEAETVRRSGPLPSLPSKITVAPLRDAAGQFVTGVTGQVVDSDTA